MASERPEFPYSDPNRKDAPAHRRGRKDSTPVGPFATPGEDEWERKQRETDPNRWREIGK